MLRIVKHLHHVDRSLVRCGLPVQSPPLNEPLQNKHFPLLQQFCVSFSCVFSLTFYRRCLSSTAAANQGDSKSKTSENANVDDGSKSGESNESSNAGKSVRGGPVSWLSVLLLVATGAGIVLYYDKEKRQHIQDIYNASKEVKQEPSAGKAAIGGPFSLINRDGKPVTQKDFLGKWTLIYVGFTHCPDICPDELLKLAAAVDKIKSNAGIELVPVFISVDPERDTVEQVREYVKEFHPRLIGLTGSPDEIRSVARSYRVYYMKTAEEDSDYLVDHSIVMYLMSPTMDFVNFFGKNNDVDSLAEGITKEIKQYKRELGRDILSVDSQPINNACTLATYILDLFEISGYIVEQLKV